jgi:hypothetical protein
MKNYENLNNRKVAYSAGLKLLNEIQMGGDQSSNSGIPDDVKLQKDYLVVLDELDNVLAGELLNKIVYEVLASLYNADVNEVINRHKAFLVQAGGKLPLNPNNYSKIDKIVENTARILGINQYNQNIQIVDSLSLKKKLRNIF